jgi:hypothetical protein
MEKRIIKNIRVNNVRKGIRINRLKENNKVKRLRTVREIINEIYQI